MNIINQNLNNLETKNQSDYLQQLCEWGFKTNPFNKTIKGIKNLMKNYYEIEKKRNDIDFDIDGIVYKVNDFSLQKRLVLWLLRLDGQLLINFLPIIQSPKLWILIFRLVGLVL